MAFTRSEELNIIKSMNITVGSNWSQYCTGNEKINSIFTKADNGDGIVQQNELDIIFSKAEDVTSKIDFKNNTGYDIKVVNTNETTEYKIFNNNKPDEFKKYTVTFTNPKTGEKQTANLNFPVDYTEEDKNNIIKQLLENFNGNIMDLMCSETDNIYFFDDNLAYIKFAGYYRRQPGNESIGVKCSKSGIFGDKRQIKYEGTFVHELGHAKDSKESAYGTTTNRLCELSKKLGNSSGPHATANPQEMYAELFRAFHYVHEGVTKSIQNEFPFLLEKIGDDENKQKFINAINMSVLRGEEFDLEKILKEAGLETEVNNLIPEGKSVEEINKEAQKSLKKYLKNSLSRYSILSYFLNSAKKHPDTFGTEFAKVMEQISYDYNHPKDAKKRTV